MKNINQNPVRFKYTIDKLVDDNKNVIKELISDNGENNIKEIAEFLSKENYPNKAITVNQLRKYYDTFLKIYYNKSTREEKKIQLLMLKAQVEYSSKRLKIFDFEKFFSNRISLVLKEENDFEKTLDALKLHFEALVGYFPKTK
jgi:CRISPR type III-A-associated protein Csm2